MFRVHEIERNVLDAGFTETKVVCGGVQCCGFVGRGGVIGVCDSWLRGGRV